MITLRPDQQAAVDAIVAVKRGIVKAPAGAGKTIIAAAALDQWKRKNHGSRKVVWLANTIEQTQQAGEALAHFELAQSCELLITCYQSNVNVEAEGADLVLCDECHHIAAAEFRKSLGGYDGPIWGFSATPEREDDLRDDVFELIGPIVHTVERAGLVETGKLLGAKVYFHAPNDKDEMKEFVEGEAEKGYKKMSYSLDYVAKQIANREDDAASWKAFRKEAKVELMSRARWHACQTYGIFENNNRNREIVSLAEDHFSDSVLILVGSIAHGKLLRDAISCGPGLNRGITPVVVYSKMGAKKRKAAIAGFRDGSIKCVIATSLADEGLDVPRANVLILASAGRSKGKAEQRSGRVLRAFVEQTHGIIHDFWDHQHPLLMNQSRARAKVYAELKYEFAGGDGVVAVLKAIGIKIHPLLNGGNELDNQRELVKAGGVKSSAFVHVLDDGKRSNGGGPSEKAPDSSLRAIGPNQSSRQVVPPVQNNLSRPNGTTSANSTTAARSDTVTPKGNDHKSNDRVREGTSGSRNSREFSTGEEKSDSRSRQIDGADSGRGFGADGSLNGSGRPEASFERNTGGEAVGSERLTTAPSSLSSPLEGEIRNGMVFTKAGWLPFSFRGAELSKNTRAEETALVGAVDHEEAKTNSRIERNFSGKSGCRLHQPSRDSGSSAPAADKTPLNTSLDCVGTAGCKTAGEVPQNTVLLAGKKLEDFVVKVEKDLGPIAPGTVIVAERKHARLSPSTLKSKAICPGFINDPDGDKTAADRGTLGHKAVETSNPDLCGDDAQLRHAVEKCLKYRETVIRDLCYGLSPYPQSGYFSFKEIRFEYFEQWGFCDEVLFVEHIAYLLDYKFAYNFYEADAPQFWAYCLGAWNKWPHLETIKVHVVHPFLDEIDIETFTRAKHYADFQVKIKAVMARANINDPATYRVSPQCSYCGFAGRCNKLAQLGFEIGKRYAPDEVTLPDTNFHGSEVTDPLVMAALLRLSPIMDKAAGGWKKAGVAMYDNGTDVPGFKMVSKKGKRAVRSTVEVYEIIKTHFAKDMSVDEFLAHCTVTATGLDEIVRGTVPKGSKDKAERELAARLEDADALTFGGGARYLIPTKETESDE